MTPAPTSPPPRRPAFILLALPVIGLLIASGMLLSSALTAADQPPPTPAAVTIPRLPTPVNVAGEAVIEFSLPALDGGTLTLADYAGRIVFLNFWATWCEPCKRELPAFVAYMRAHPAPTDPIIIAVNIEETPEQIYQFMAENGLDLSALPIALDADGAVADSYGVFNIPVTFVIDATGVVRYPSYGELTADDIANYLLALDAPSLEATAAPEAES